MHKAVPFFPHLVTTNALGLPFSTGFGTQTLALITALPVRPALNPVSTQYVCFVLFETGSHYRVLAGLKLDMQIRLVIASVIWMPELKAEAGRLSS